MKRGRIVALTLAVLLVFAAVLVAYLPASWVIGRLPAQLGLSCLEANGSIWQGECIGFAYHGTRLGDATWNLERLGALSGRLVGDLDLRGNGITLRADVDSTFKGDGEVRNVVAHVPLDPQFLPQLPPNQRANVDVDMQRATFAAGRPRSLSGSVDVRDLRQLDPAVELGSYRAEFDGVEHPDGSSVGKVRDLGGPFLVVGVITLTPPNGYVVNGQISGRTGDAEKIVREITLGAPPDASGRSEFAFEGTY
jgi:hypothetical protein